MNTIMSAISCVLSLMNSIRLGILRYSWSSGHVCVVFLQDNMQWGSNSRSLKSHAFTCHLMHTCTSKSHATSRASRQATHTLFC